LFSWPDLITVCLEFSLLEGGKMRTLGKWIVLVVASIVASSGATMAQTGSDPARALANPIGKFVKVTGAVTVERANAAVVQASASANPPPVKEGDLVYRGDVVLTAADAKASLVFADGTAFNISGNARMELNEFVYNPDGKSNTSLFGLLKGTFTFVAGKIAKTGNMRVDTPVATMGIRGTTPHVVVSEDGTVKFSTLVEEKR
jgi:hypothetical protein